MIPILEKLFAKREKRREIVAQSEMSYLQLVRKAAAGIDLSEPETTRLETLVDQLNTSPEQLGRDIEIIAHHAALSKLAATAAAKRKALNQAHADLREAKGATADLMAERRIAENRLFLGGKEILDELNAAERAQSELDYLVADHGQRLELHKIIEVKTAWLLPHAQTIRENFWKTEAMLKTGIAHPGGKTGNETQALVVAAERELKTAKAEFESTMQFLAKTAANAPQGVTVFNLQNSYLEIKPDHEILVNINLPEFDFQQAPGQSKEEFNDLKSRLLAVCAQRDRRNVEFSERLKAKNKLAAAAA